MGDASGRPAVRSAGLAPGAWALCAQGSEWWARLWQRRRCSKSRRGARPKHSVRGHVYWWRHKPRWQNHEQGKQGKVELSRAPAVWLEMPTLRCSNDERSKTCVLPPPRLALSWPMSLRSGRNQAECGRFRAKFGRMWPSSARSWPDFGKRWATFVGMGPMLVGAGRFRPKLSIDATPSSVDSRPSLVGVARFREIRLKAKPKLADSVLVLVELLLSGAIASKPPALPARHHASDGRGARVNAASSGRIAAARQAPS